ncbi:MAG: hydroxymethylglutaryl-CoA lyase [Desulfobacterales bacterium]
MDIELPKKVTLIEVGPRDGFQFEKQFIPTELKSEIICRLVEAGLKHIQVASFVNPSRVPQMADAEEVVSRLLESAGVIFSGLVLNAKGLQRALRAGLKHVEISISASDTHSRKNAGVGFDQAVTRMKEMIRLARAENMGVRAGIQCVFGCVYEGNVSRERILSLVRYYAANQVDAIALSDTTGMANPVSVKRLLQTLIPECGKIPIILHLHDTRGLGLANLMAALQCGVTQFDTAMAGMGGCPFVRGAAGNIATEDTVHLMDSMGISTGIDIIGVSKCSHYLEDYLSKQFPGRMHRLLQQTS